MATDDDNSPLSIAVRRAAEAVADKVRDRSPSDRIASRWHLTKRSDGSAHVINSDMAAVMTNSGGRHPLFGNRKHWYAENERNPERTGWAERAAEDGLNEALQDIADEVAQSIAGEFNNG